MFRRRKLGILALCETKMKGQGDCDFGGVEGRYSGVAVEAHASEGVAILVSEEVKGWVTEWREVTSRIMWVKLKIERETWVIISAYGPGSERSVEQREVRADRWSGGSLWGPWGE